MKQFMIYNADKIGDLPKVTWMVDGLIQDGGFGVLYGPSGSYKSFLTLDIALHVSQTAPVVYVAAEGASGGWHNRVVAWCALHKKPASNLHFIFDSIKMLDVERPGGDVEAFIESIRHLKPRLVVIDTMHRCIVGGSDSSDRDVGNFVYACDQIRECLGCAVMVVHHAGKSGEYRGSSALLGAADTFFSVKVTKNGRVQLKAEKVKDGPEDFTFEMAHVGIKDSLVFLPAGVVMNLKPVADDLDSTEIEILRFADLSIWKNADFKVADVADGTNLPRSSLYRKLSVLKDSGMLAYDEQKKSYSITATGIATIKKIQDVIENRSFIVDGKRVEIPQLDDEAQTVSVKPWSAPNEHKRRFEALRGRDPDKHQDLQPQQPTDAVYGGFRPMDGYDEEPLFGDEDEEVVGRTELA